MTSGGRASEVDAFVECHRLNVIITSVEIPKDEQTGGKGAEEERA